MRSPLIAKKLGMTSLYDQNGSVKAATVLEVTNCTVLGKKTTETDGYSALLVGYGKVLRNPKKPHAGIFSKLSLPVLKSIGEFRLNQDQLEGFVQGDSISISTVGVAEGQLVDVTATSIGKGFSGVIKRHHFSGLEASHGVSLSHRSHGSTGGRQDPGKVFKNKKMAGHLGAKRVTTQNLRVFSLDAQKGLIILLGAVPGPKGGSVFIRDAVK